jgi:cytochrome b561
MSSTATPLAVPTLEPRSYDAVYKLIHWTVVALLIIQALTKLIPTAWVSEDTLNAWHLSIGPTILLLMLIRLFWRLTHRPPPPPADLPPALQLLARGTHWAFYVLLIVLPLLGWLSASAYGVRPYLLGLVPLPMLVNPDKALAERVGSLHGDVALVLLAVIVLHVAGALYHALIKRDGVIQRMLPFGRPGAP